VLPRKPAAAGKPRFALAIATACGLGYLRPAPGTWGSLGGLIVTLAPWILWNAGGVLSGIGIGTSGTLKLDPLLLIQIFVTIGLAITGVFTARRAAEFFAEKDPQRVVIDEVSGQHLTFLIGGFWPTFTLEILQQPRAHPLGMFQILLRPNWKYLVLGFILFRVFDIWKPFPARNAEKLPGGWGIMADDWIAAIYAAIGLWIARALGL